MTELKSEEERLKQLIARIDAQIIKFEKLLSKVKGKQKEIRETVSKTGFGLIPVTVKSDFSSSTDLEAELNQHILDLNKTKNFIARKLDLIIKEEELIDRLKKEFGEKISIKKLEKGDFEIAFFDSDTKKIFDEINASKQNIEEIKKTVEKIIKKQN